MSDKEPDTLDDISSSRTIPLSVATTRAAEKVTVVATNVQGKNESANSNDSNNDDITTPKLSSAVVRTTTCPTTATTDDNAAGSAKKRGRGEEDGDDNINKDKDENVDNSADCVEQSNKRTREGSDSKGNDENDGEENKNNKTSTGEGNNDNDNNNTEQKHNEEEEEEDHEEQKSDTHTTKTTAVAQKNPPPPIIHNGHVDFSLSLVNKHLICPLCNGYFRDPYTIAECLHTFCKSCLFFAFRSGYRRCPECEISLEPDPFKEVLSDRTLQEIVHKIFPKLCELDEREERLFYARRGIRLKKEFMELEQVKTDQRKEDEGEEGRKEENDTDNDGGDIKKKGNEVMGDDTTATETGGEGVDHSSLDKSGGEKKKISPPPDELNFALVPDGNVPHGFQMPRLENPLLRTSGRLKVVQLKRYLIKKLKLNANSSAVEILCNGDPLGDELSLTFVQRTRWLDVIEDLVLTYRFGEDGIY